MPQPICIDLIFLLNINPTNGRLTGPAQPEKGEPSKAVNGKEEDESWEAHLGSNQDPLTSILIR